MISLARKDDRWVLRASNKASALAAARVARVFSIKSFEFISYDCVTDLKFLGAWKKLEWLRIFAPNLGSLDGINSQAEVKSLSIETKARAFFNFDCFRNLETLVIPGELISHSSGSSRKLKRIVLFTPSRHSLLRLQQMPALSSLRLQTFGESDFWNVILPGLTELRVDDARKLSSLSRIGQSSNIQRLVINGAPSLRDIEDIIDLQALRELEFCGCGKLQSVLPIKSLKNLHSLRIFDSSVADQELLFLNDLPNLEEFLFNQAKELGLK